MQRVRIVIIIQQRIIQNRTKPVYETSFFYVSSLAVLPLAKKGEKMARVLGLLLI